MIPAPTNSGLDGFVPHPGGAVFNTAIALGRLGAKVSLTTGISTDMFGQQLENALAASRVDTSYLVRSDRPTTLAFVQLLHGHASYSFFDENSAGRMLDAEDMPDLTSDIDALYFGGISLACEPGAEAYAALLERERDGRAVMMDPNIRPGFIADEGRYRARLSQMIKNCDILKVSDEDLDWIVSDSTTIEEKAKQLLGQGPSLVIVTRGGDGASGFHASGFRCDVPAGKADVVDTVGAGDTFNAGVLAQLNTSGQLTKAGLASLTQKDVEDALVHGARVAAITVSRAGANPPWSNEI